MPTPQETLAQIKAGAEKIQSELKGSITPTPSPETTSFDLATAWAKLQEGTGVVSSEPTALDKAVEGMITRLEEAGKKKEAGITAGAERLAGEIREAGERRLTTDVFERQRGFATHQALIKQITEETDKSLRDLELRKQEAIGSGAVEQAEKISNLQLRSIEFKEESRQKAFTNLLNLASAGLQFKQEERLGRQQSFSEQQAVSKIALDFGVEVREGDTIETITARAQPFASEKQKLELEKQKADIARANAEATKALRGDDFETDSLTIDVVATAANVNPAVLATIKDPLKLSKVLNRMTELSKPRDFGDVELQNLANVEFNSGTSFNEALGKISTDPRISNKAKAEEILREKYGKQVKPRDATFKVSELTLTKEQIEESKEKARKRAEERKEEARKRVEERKGILVSKSVQLGNF